MVRGFICAALRSKGYTVLEAADGAEAVQIAARHSGALDLLVLDLVMPLLSGQDVAQRLKANRPKLRVVFMSGYSSLGASSQRILPAGWRDDAPEAARIAPVGIGADADFRGGEDLVHYAVALPDGASGRIVIVATLLYQSVPPSWVEPLRAVEADEAKTIRRAPSRRAATPSPSPARGPSTRRANKATRWWSARINSK